MSANAGARHAEKLQKVRLKSCVPKHSELSTWTTFWCNTSAYGGYIVMFEPACGAQNAVYVGSSLGFERQPKHQQKIYFLRSYFGDPTNRVF